MDYQLNSADFADYLYSRQPFAPGMIRHERLGTIGFTPHQMHGMQAVELDWQLPANRIVLADTVGGNDAINISFQVNGNMFTRFAGIHHPLDMKAGTHNLVYLSEQGDMHAIEAKQHLSVFQVTISKDFFIQILEAGHQWSDNLLHKLDTNTPFAAAEKPAAITPRMYHLIKSLQSDLTPGPMKKLLFQSKLLELVALQIEQLSRFPKQKPSCCTGDDLAKLQALKNFLEHHFLQDLSLTQLSRVSCLNEFKLKKGFKTAFGKTVFGYIRELRMEHAAKLLHDTAQTVDEVADALGYEHAHHFSKAFKDYTGYVPSAYRRGACA